MKTGMNLLLLEQIKTLGFDSVEVPIFAVESGAPCERLRRRLTLAARRPRRKRSATV